MAKTKAQDTAKKKTSVKEKAETVVVTKEKTVKATAPKVKKEYAVQAYGTGRRKNSVARVWVRSGTGEFTINHRTFESYFVRDAHRRSIVRPFIATKTSGQYDVFCTVKGGGISGQAGALIHGIARALDKIDAAAFHQALRSGGFLTRDPRVVERKKYGQHKARKSTQFSKR